MSEDSSIRSKEEAEADSVEWMDMDFWNLARRSDRVRVLPDFCVQGRILEGRCC